MWQLPFLMCDIYISFDVICSTASIRASQLVENAHQLQ